VEQIANAMQHINQATYQSLASTRQTEQSALTLNELSQRMSLTIQHYQVDGGNGRSADEAA
jgi:methyl-accepting chemotaxis protein